MKNIFLCFAMACGMLSCSDSFLSEEPVGELSTDQAVDKNNIEGIIISAYSVLDGQFDDASSALNSACSNWQFGDVTSDDAYKGGGGTGDQNQIHLIEIFNANPTVQDFERKWLALYEGVKRCNLAIRILEASDYDKKEQRLAEMKFLRGHFYFNLKIIYNQIPYIDETVIDMKEYSEKSNVEFSSEQLWEKILDDFEYAYNVLPENQSDYGRPTRMAARAYMAKVNLYQGKWEACEKACDDVIASGKYSLEPNFRDVFLPEKDNGNEIVFAIQCSINDGSPNNYNGNPGDRLLPPGGPYPQYGFMRPTQNLVNAYKTNSDGLPFDNGVDLTDNDNVDVRLDHTLARPGIMFLDIQVYDWTPREVSVYGPFSPKKRLVSTKSEHYLSKWPYVNDLNWYVIRYADVLLWKAESAINLGKLDLGREYINKVRARAKGSETVKTEDGLNDAAKYLVGLYEKPFLNKESALQALRTERRLEFAHEGMRFFDLVRWGIADQVINKYLDKEKLFRSHLQNAHFKKGVNEYFPIPQSVIDLCGSEVIHQNNGY